jgi:hypothetical protein
LFIETSAGIHPRSIVAVPLIENGSPFVEVFDADELIADIESCGVGSGVLDPKFAHGYSCSLRSIELFGESEMFEHDFALFENAWRWW